MSIADAPAPVAGHRANRVISSVRTAPYIRKWLVLGALIGVVAGLGAVVFFEGLSLATRLLLTDIGGFTSLDVRWAAPRRSPPSRCSWPPTTPATSTEWSSSSTAVPPSSETRRRWS
jgi:hypothetical protein